MRRFGPLLTENGAVFRLWAPTAASVELVRPDAPALPMQPRGAGFFECFVPGTRPGQAYMFRTGGLDVPDPASRAQADDADGWSLLVAPLPPPRSGAIRPWHEAILSEVHVGAASPEGSFAGLAARLDHFRDAGFTAIELMPLADFTGARNWGYDGVLPFAPDARYGRPEDLRALIEAAHARGMGVMIDVVYNHFGPSGNFLHHYAPDFFAPGEPTPWGPAIALDNPLVRAFFCENARMWLEDYDADGLRFDAVHALRTMGADLFLDEVAATARAVKPDAWLVLENDANQARWLERDGAGRPRRFTAQWDDDRHHAFRVLTTGDSAGYFADYAHRPIGSVERALTEGFVYQGETSRHRGAPRGEPSAHLPPDAFVAFLQNHDQIGNRPLGDRIVEALAPEKRALQRFALMLSPHVPMAFMGEEAGLDTPFPYFCDFDGALADAVRHGRREEFAAFFDSHPGSPDALPDPLAPETFEAAKLPWRRLAEPAPRRALDDFRGLAELRRRLVWPLAAGAFRGAGAQRNGAALLVSWRFADGALTMALNLGDEAGSIGGPGRAPDAAAGEVRIDGAATRLGPWAAALWSEPVR
ncbi:malto-oligosyltrehalose trehalohydrolase [Labrys wisconsinensis]|uniref:Malto-oligosyltrehalose trehalohydrolase n=1 Tax=Labrys wisconsinensis TaxID=425677 RepID=A0ABU0JEA9_9HYPH|nr:malto-oligosyltrehalose trehalohydrolase [Labrys wisconsinensis]MDQ0472609.1 malto-oligosyltrehalose trehalohydrolase [Labrys wisconsinensis]